MKKFLLSLSLAIAINMVNYSQDLKEILQNTLTMLDSAKSVQDMFNAANRLELIAGKWDTTWITHYYCTYSFGLVSYYEKDVDKRDGYLDKADKHLERTKALVKTSNDELFVLAAFIANARLSVKPESRWKKYGDIFNAEIDSAKAIRPENPRIYFLEANSVYYRPKMFGGGEKNALPYYQKAEELYNNETENDIFKPSWGKNENSKLLEKCKNADKE